ncbi:MAG: type II secretion system protein [Candidatus Roizmanbacteria bacterium]|nr:MAG: type II secretion system protein [Candidatus Roizmanbacteria bacterium]
MKKKRLGFTLIEMLIVISAIGLTLPALFSIFYVILNQQIKVYRLTEVKRQGDYILGKMDSMIRSNAVGIYSDSGLATVKCSNTLGNNSYSSTGGSDFYLKDKNNNYFQFALSFDRMNLISTNASYQSGFLSTSKIKVENFAISCERSAQFSGPIISVSFDICYGTNSCSNARVEEQASLSYKTNFKLRNIEN